VSLNDLKHELLWVLDDMETNKRISPNYPIAPSTAEVKFVRKFMGNFYSYAVKKRLSVRQAKSQYPAFVGEMISKINDLEYRGPR
jgi:hypothetical protein